MSMFIGNSDPQSLLTAEEARDVAAQVQTMDKGYYADVERLRAGGDGFAVMVYHKKIAGPLGYAH